MLDRSPEGFKLQQRVLLETVGLCGYLLWNRYLCIGRRGDEHGELSLPGDWEQYTVATSGSLPTWGYTDLLYHRTKHREHSGHF